MTILYKIFLCILIYTLIQVVTSRIFKKLDGIEGKLYIQTEILRSLENNIFACKERIDSIEDELELINEKLVVGDKEEKICQLVDEKDMLKKEIERLNKLNQNMIENYRYFYSTPTAFPSIWEGRFPFWEGRFL